MLIAASAIPPEEPTLPDLPELDHDDLSVTSKSDISELSPDPFDPVAAATSRHDDLAKLVDALEERSARLDSGDHATKAAHQALRERIRLLGIICDGLEGAVLVAAQQDALEGPLAPYLATTYLWLDAVGSALLTLTNELAEMEAEWPAFRSALAEVSWLYEMSVEEQRRIEERSLFVGTELGACLAYVFRGLSHFKVSLDASFG